MTAPLATLIFVLAAYAALRALAVTVSAHRVQISAALRGRATWLIRLRPKA